VQKAAANTVGLQTLRYKGFPEFVKVLVDIGFLSTEEQSFLKEPITWKKATQKILGASSSSEEDLLWAISSKTTFKDNDEKNQLMAGLKWGKQPCTPFIFPFLVSLRCSHRLSKVQSHVVHVDLHLRHCLSTLSLLERAILTPQRSWHLLRFKDYSKRKSAGYSVRHS
jgi:hypothetical protein